MQQEIKSPHRQILRLPAVMAQTGMGRSWIYKEIAAGRFPPPAKIGRASGWDAACVNRWVEDRLEVAVITDVVARPGAFRRASEDR